MSEDPDKRRLHIEAAKAVVWYGAQPARVAEKLGVSERTIYYWIDLVMGYDEPEAVRIRAVREGRSA